MEYEEKTVREERKYSGNIINVNRATVILPNGKQATRDIVRHPGASVVVPITDNGELLLVKQYRKPCEMISLELPAGKLDEGESPETCAVRELEEETGYIAGNIYRAMSVHSTPGFSDEVLHIFVAMNLSEGSFCPDEDEFISCRKYTVEQCLQMICDGQITDAKTIIGIYLADKIQKGEYKIS
ncbi:MAG: NUDIX hydrolase [Clostridiaceae bacterium]|jgi:ADP-ribose pyrophosphatase|nr:NUDIX hydrolase [Clostridiaceae bacterium]